MSSPGEQSGYKPRGVKVPPLSYRKIRNVTIGLRGLLDEPSDYIDVVSLLEFKLYKMGVNYHYCDAFDLGDGVAAKALPSDGIILISNEIYNKACDGDGMARFTIMHEVGHMALHRPELIGLARGTATNSKSHKAYEDSEWQADVFAAEFLMPINRIIGDNMTCSEIQQAFGVSTKAAKIRLQYLKNNRLMK